MPFKSYNRQQDWLLPPSLGELIPQDHPVRFVAEFVDNLPWAEVGIAYQPETYGAAAYPPQVLLAIWLYGFMTRTRSTRKLERACHESVPMMWLAGGLRPDHSTLSRFYKQNRRAMRPLFKATVSLAVEVGLVDFALQAVDGTRMSAAAMGSLHSRAEISKLLAAVEQELAAMEAANAGEEQEGQTPRGPRARWGREQVRAHLQQALAEMDRRAKLPGGRNKADVASSSDPEAGLVKSAKGYVTGYNAQAVVDSKAQVVVGADVISASPDGGQLLPMLDEARAMTGRDPQAAAADSGYFEMGAILKVEARGIEVFIPQQQPKKQSGKEAEQYTKAHFTYDPASDTYTCPEGKTLTFKCSGATEHGKPCPSRVYRGRDCRDCAVRARGLCTRSASGRCIKRYKHDDDLPSYLAKLRSPRGRQVRRQRAGTVEPLFASTKERLGMLRFLLRGLLNAKAEWHLTCAVHNLRKLWRYWWLPKRRPVAAAA